MGNHRGQGPLSLQQAVVHIFVSLITSLSVESDNAQLLHMLLALERELTSHRVCTIWTIPIFQ